jgi:hypothetical protein
MKGFVVFYFSPYSYNVYIKNVNGWYSCAKYEQYIKF